MEKKFSMNDLTVIKGYEALTDNQLDLVKGGISAGAADCNCGSENHNRDGGSCTCEGAGNTNAKIVKTISK
ncbi:MAG: hypothetical protein LBK94_02385 [Prevotellaceae bacterium]|jgi:hypothetical protein|nr:hypothetical protein [Prevotellaceae bacterium]